MYLYKMYYYANVCTIIMRVITIIIIFILFINNTSFYDVIHYTAQNEARVAKLEALKLERIAEMINNRPPTVTDRILGIFPQYTNQHHRISMMSTINDDFHHYYVYQHYYYDAKQYSNQTIIRLS